MPARAERSGLKSVFRDATLFKMIYASGCAAARSGCSTHDFTRNPTATEFRPVRARNVRWGVPVKAPRLSAAVLVVFDWTRPVIEEYVTDVLPLFDTVQQLMMLWPTERQSRDHGSYIGMRFAEYRDDLGFDAALHPHCLRHCM